MSGTRNDINNAWRNDRTAASRVSLYRGTGTILALIILWYAGARLPALPDRSLYTLLLPIMTHFIPVSIPRTTIHPRKRAFLILLSTFTGPAIVSIHGYTSSVYEFPIQA